MTSAVKAIAVPVGATRMSKIFRRLLNSGGPSANFPSVQRAEADLDQARLFLPQIVPVGPGLFLGSFALREIYRHGVFFIITQAGQGVEGVGQIVPRFELIQKSFPAFHDTIALLWRKDFIQVFPGLFFDLGDHRQPVRIRKPFGQSFAGQDHFGERAVRPA